MIDFRILPPIVLLKFWVHACNRGRPDLANKAADALACHNTCVQTRGQFDRALEAMKGKP